MKPGRGVVVRFATFAPASSSSLWLSLRSLPAAVAAMRRPNRADYRGSADRGDPGRTDRTGRDLRRGQRGLSDPLGASSTETSPAEQQPASTPAWSTASRASGCSGSCGYPEFAAAEALATAEDEVSLAAQRGDTAALETAESNASSCLANFQSAAEEYGFEECSEGPSAPVSPDSGPESGETGSEAPEEPEAEAEEPEVEVCARIRKPAVCGAPRRRRHRRAPEGRGRNRWWFLWWRRPRLAQTGIRPASRWAIGVLHQELPRKRPDEGPPMATRPPRTLPRPRTAGSKGRPPRSAPRAALARRCLLPARRSCRRGESSKVGGRSRSRCCGNRRSKPRSIVFSVRTSTFDVASSRMRMGLGDQRPGEGDQLALPRRELHAPRDPARFRLAAPR